MELNQNNADNSKEIANETENFIRSKTIENLNYLSTNSNPIKQHISWFKGSRDRGFKLDIAS